MNEHDPLARFDARLHEQLGHLRAHLHDLRTLRRLADGDDEDGGAGVREPRAPRSPLAPAEQALALA